MFDIGVYLGQVYNGGRGRGHPLQQVRGQADGKTLTILKGIIKNTKAAAMISFLSCDEGRFVTKSTDKLNDGCLG